MSLITCPLPTEPSDIFIDACPEDFGQVQKVILQRTYSSGSTKNGFVIASANPNLKASWDTYLAASDSTKAVQTPFVSNPENEPGGPVTFGGGNQTRNGIELVVGREPSPFNAVFYQTNSRSIKNLKTYEQESANAALSVYLVDQYGRIGGTYDDIVTAANFRGIPIYSFFVGDKGFGGFEAPDFNNLQWMFPPNWSDDFAIVTPSDFDALTDLVTP